MTSQDSELGLGDYVTIVKRQWMWIVATFVVVVGLVAAFTFTRPSVFVSDSDVLILTDQSRGLFAFEPAVEDRLERNAVAELQLMSSQQYQRDVEQEIGVPVDLEFELVSPVGSEDSSASSVLRVTARADNAREAQTAAQTFADSYVSERSSEDLAAVESSLVSTQEILDTLAGERRALLEPLSVLRTERAGTTDPLVAADLDRQILEVEIATADAIASLNDQVGLLNVDLIALRQAVASLRSGTAATRILDAAPLPSGPVSPDVPRSMAIGVLVALLLGFLLATVRELLDPTNRNAADLATLVDLPVIASIPRLPKDRFAPGGVARFTDLNAEHANSYRVLLNSLWFNSNGETTGSIAVTAGHRGLGSTQTAVNIAQAEASRGVAVCLIDADFSQPSVVERLGLVGDEHVGLADLLAERCSPDETIQLSGHPHLDYIGAGAVDLSTPDLLRSHRLRTLISKLLDRYELIVVDTPPSLGPIDSRTVTSQCDGVIVVYQPGDSKNDDVVDTVAGLRAAHARPVGLVANRSAPRQPVQPVQTRA